MATIQEIKDKLAEQDTVVKSTVALVQELTKKVRENISDPAALDEVLREIEDNTAELVNAVKADTVAEAEEPAVQSDLPVTE